MSAFCVIGLGYVTGLVADRPLPFGGTLATASVLAIAVVARTTAGPVRLRAPSAPRWARWSGIAGLAALTAGAAIVDYRHGGNGWPGHLADWGWGYDGVPPGFLAEAGLLALAGTLLAGSVLGRAGRVIRVGNLPAAALSLPLLFALVLTVRPGSGPAGPGAVIALALVTLALLALAVNAALLNGRPAPMAAAGLVPVAVALTAVALTLTNQRAERTLELQWQAAGPPRTQSSGSAGAGSLPRSVTGGASALTRIDDEELLRQIRSSSEYPALTKAEQRGLAYQESLRPAGLSADITPAVDDHEPHWWRGAGGGLLLIGLLGVALRGSREA